MTTLESNNYPKAKGQRFKTHLLDGIYTVDGFFGASGIEYNSIEECRENNKKGLICIKIKETGGSLRIEDALLSHT